MPIRPITASIGLELERGSAVVCIPIPGNDEWELADEQALATVRSVIQCTPASTPILITGTAAQIEKIAAEPSVRAHDGITLSLSLQSGANETHAVNVAAGVSFPSDLVLVTAGTRVTSKWFGRLRAAAMSDSTVASATPLSVSRSSPEGGGLERCGDLDVSVSLEVAASPQLDGEHDQVSSLEELARRVGDGSLRLHPRIPVAGPGCAYIRRAALELGGPLNETLSLGSAVGDFASRMVAAGMVHVAADDVLVGSSSRTCTPPDTQCSPSPPRTEGQLRETLVDDEHGGLSRALAIARMALRRLTVTIDGRALTAAIGGTQTYILELIMALAREPSVALRVLVAPDLSPRAAAALATHPEVELLTYEQAANGARLTDVVHRPQPIFTADDLMLLRLLGERVIVGQLDLIAYHNYSYHRDVDHWRAFRRTTRLALGGADQVIFFSEHARRDALAEDLLPEGRTHVVSVGAEVLEPTNSIAAAPEDLPLEDPFLLCLGADYAHKNRAFAILLLDALREQGWNGRLVFAGAHIPFGSSRERERELLQSRPELAPWVLNLGPVDEASKMWLYQHARALVYPTLYEGFGLLPLEAARAGLPCLFAPQASLSDIAGTAATLVPWDAHASAAAVLPLLADGPQRDSHLAELRALAIPTWDEVARRLVAVYRHAIARPAPEAAPRMWQELERESYIVRLDRDVEALKTTAQEYQDAYHALEERVATGLPLVDRDGLLNQAQQRGLMRIAARKPLGPVLLAPLGWLGRRAR